MCIPILETQISSGDAVWQHYKIYPRKKNIGYTASHLKTYFFVNIHL